MGLKVCVCGGGGGGGTNIPMPPNKKNAPMPPPPPRFLRQCFGNPFLSSACVNFAYNRSACTYIECKINICVSVQQKRIFYALSLNTFTLTAEPMEQQ